MNTKLNLYKLLSKIGLDVRKYPNRLIRNRMKLFQNHQVDLIFDVGANLGQYGVEVFSNGYLGDMISFEPIKSIYNELNKLAKKNTNWRAFNFGLGDKVEEININIADSPPSSSILELHKNHEAASQLSYIGKEIIRLDTLDNYLRENDISNYRKVFLKIDTQGYEFNVLMGAENSLDSIIGVQLEMSLFPLYKGEMLFNEMLLFLTSKGFVLHSLEPGFSNHETGQLLQVDGVFFRK